MSSGPVERPDRAGPPRLGGWVVAVVFFGVVGGAAGWFNLKGSDKERADHVLKWGVIWSVGTAVFYVVVVLVALALLTTAASNSTVALEPAPVVTHVPAGPSATTASGLQNAFTPNNATIAVLKGRVASNPNDASAWRDLGTEYETKQKLPDAINALEHYTALRPNDADALGELASQYIAAAQVAFSAGPSAHTKFLAAETQAENTFKRVAALEPNDATTDLQLGQVAMTNGDKPTAIQAFRRFLELAPNDVEAPSVRQSLQQLTG